MRQKPADGVRPVVAAVRIHEGNVSSFADSVDHHGMREPAAGIGAKDVTVLQMCRQKRHQPTGRKTAPGQTHRGGNRRNFYRRCDAAGGTFAPCCDEACLGAIWYSRVDTRPTFQGRSPAAVDQRLRHHRRQSSGNGCHKCSFGLCLGKPRKNYGYRCSCQQGLVARFAVKVAPSFLADNPSCHVTRDVTKLGHTIKLATVRAII